MYWNRLNPQHDSEVSLLDRENPDFQSIIKHLDEQYRLGLEAELRKYALGHEKAPIRSIKRKSLRFYKQFSDRTPPDGQSLHDSNSSESKGADQAKPPELFEVELDLSAIDERYGDKSLTNYEWTRVYLVRVGKEKIKDKADDESEQSTDGYEWYLLNGESGVLHALNAKFGGINIDNSSCASEYLDFFCSFLCSEEGVFALIQQEADLTELEDHGERFKEELYKRRGHAIFAQKQTYIRQPWGEVEAELKEKLQKLNGPQPNLSGQGASGEGGDLAATDSQTEKKKEWYGLVLYDKEVREARFELTESGVVTMVGDQKVQSGLPVRRHTTVRHKRSGIIRFAKSASRKLISAAEFKEYVLKATGVARFYNVLIEENLRFDPTDRVGALECLDVHFLGEVTFDHCHVSAVFRFEDCKFLGGFRAPGTTFTSQVSFEKSETFFLSEMWLAQPPTQRQGGDYPVALNLNYARVNGSLGLERLTVHGSVSCRHLTVKSDANFRGLQVVPLVDGNQEDPQGGKEKSNKPKLPFKAAPGNGPVLLDLQRSSFAGSLNLGISVEKEVGLKKGKVLRRTRVTVCGDCRFDTMSVGKSLIIEGLAVVKPNNEVDLKDYRYGALDWPLSLSMSNVMVKGNIQSWEYDSWDVTGQTILPPLVVDGTIDLKWSKIGGYVDLRMSQVRENLDCIGVCAAWLTLQPSRLNDVSSNDDERRKAGERDWVQYSVLDPVSLSPPVGNAPSKWMEAFTWRMSSIGGDLKLGNAIIPGGVTLTGTTVKGTVDVRLGAQLGQIKAMPAFGIDTEFETKKRTVVKQSAFLGGLSIRDSTIAGPVYLWGARVGKENAGNQNAAPRPVIDIATSNLKGGLYLHVRSSWEGQQIVLDSFADGKHWRDDEKASTDWVGHQGHQVSTNKDNFEHGADAYFWKTVSDIFHTTVNGNVDVLASDIGTDLDLTNTKVMGRVRLNDSHVKCDVRAVACLQELDVKEKAPPQSEREAALQTGLKTTCKSFEFQSLRCDGDLMLAGLVTEKDVDGRNAVVQGHVEFVSEGREATIKGTLTLCGFEVGLLRVSGKSFEERGTIDLARATISTLNISTRLSIKINLQSIKVNHWEIMKSEQEKQEDAILSLLDATKEHYDSWPYKSIENWLIAKGEDDAAKAVFRRKNQAEWEKKDKYIHNSLTNGKSLSLISSWCWHHVKEWMWGRFMGFGTILWKAVVLWVALSLFLAWVLSNPNNVQPTFAAVNVGLGKIKFDDIKMTEIGAKIQDTRNELQKQFPKEREWGFRHAFWLALDITVPLVPFNLHDEWEPRDSTENTVFPFCLRSEMPIAPKMLANIFVVASWFIWSLFATALAGAMWTRK
ncbi:MAG: hypothetical protein OJF47_003512 [Nitrospira sp.]|jgi:hypothetical protein|nr:MAG: hypothetical protein OJF47_003512 [Nitrospira sp.]